MQTMNVVTASTIGAIGYRGRSRTLHVQMSNGAHYVYFNVPVEVYDSFLGSASKIRYFNENIRGKYDYIKMN